MRHSPDLPPDDAGSNSDWMDAVANRRLTAAEIGTLRRELAARPSEAKRFEEELALNAILDARCVAPKASSNFAAQVVARIADQDRQSRAVPHRSGWWVTLVGLRPIWAMAAVVLTGVILWQTLGHRRLSEMVATVEAIALTASTPGLPAESLEDYEAIRHLGTIPQPGDDALIAALAENSTP